MSGSDFPIETNRVALLIQDAVNETATFKYPGIFAPPVSQHIVLAKDRIEFRQAESEERINRLEAKLSASVTDTTNIEPLWDKAISSISNLDVLYENGTVTKKRKIIGSMFPEKLTFDGFQYRTARVNEALVLMLLIDSKIKGKKNGTNPSFLDLSREVTPPGFEPRSSEPESEILSIELWGQKRLQK